MMRCFVVFSILMVCSGCQDKPPIVSDEATVRIVFNFDEKISIRGSAAHSSSAVAWSQSELELDQIEIDQNPPDLVVYVPKNVEGTWQVLEVGEERFELEQWVVYLFKVESADNVRVEKRRLKSNAPSLPLPVE